MMMVDVFMWLILNSLVSKFIRKEPLDQIEIENDKSFIIHSRAITTDTNLDDCDVGDVVGIIYLILWVYL